MTFIWFCLISYGLTQILVYGKIFDRIRPKEGKLGQLLSCPMCTGFWVGVFLFGINGLTELFNFEYNIANLLILGCIASATSYFLNVVIGDLGIKLVTVNSTLIETRSEQ